MFLLLGNPLGGMAGIAALVAAAGAAAFALRKKVPHPTEFWAIGESAGICLLSGSRFI
jgi:hypothetical protein